MRGRDMSKTLDEMLNISELPVLVKADGTYETATYPPATLPEYAPESITLDWSGSWDAPDVMETHERDALASVENEWEALTGWADDGSLFIFRAERRHLGEDLEQHIRETPGLWAVVPVEMHPPQCDAGKSGMPCAEFDARERCEHADYPAESEAAGWALVHRNRAVTLGDAVDHGVNAVFESWPVLRDGMGYGWVIQERKGYRMLVPGDLTESGESHRGPQRVFRDDARKDAEEWLTVNVA
jgi:hypothetical protein